MAGTMRDWLTTRRRLVWSGAAALGVGALGLGWFAFSSPKELVFSLIQRALPGVRLDRDSVGLCAEEVLSWVDASFQGSLVARTTSIVKLKGVQALSQVLGIERVASIDAFEGRLEAITRMAITLLLPHSNFFEVADPTAETVYFYPPEPNAACGNPFADLSPPA